MLLAQEFFIPTADQGQSFFPPSILRSRGCPQQPGNKELIHVQMGRIHPWHPLHSLLQYWAGQIPFTTPGTCPANAVWAIKAHFCVSHWELFFWQDSQHVWNSACVGYLWLMQMRACCSQAGWRIIVITKRIGRRHWEKRSLEGSRKIRQIPEGVLAGEKLKIKLVAFAFTQCNCLYVHGCVGKALDEFCLHCLSLCQSLAAALVQPGVASHVAFFMWTFMH